MAEEFQFVEKVPPDMICSICKLVLHQPHLVNCCEQHFCKYCLKKWMKTNSSCPHCRSTGFTHMLMKQKSRKIGELKVYCVNRKYGCDAVLKYIDCRHHISPTNKDGCPYVTLTCPDNCGKQIFRSKMMEHHEKFCIHRIVSCTYCKQKGKYNLMVQHVNKCPQRPVACPQGCGVQIIPNDLELHKNVCPLELVPCTYSELGCKADICRRDMKQHLESTDHTSMIAKSFVVLKEEHRILEKSHRILEKNHTTLADKCVALQDKNATLQIQQHTLSDSHTSLQREHAALKAEHRRFKKDHDKLSAMCAAIQLQCRSLQTELAAFKSKGTEGTFLKSPAESCSPSDHTPDDGGTASTDSLHAKGNSRSLLAAKGKDDTSEQDLGSEMFLQLFGSPNYHHIVLAGHTKLTLEWEIDDLFPDPGADITCFHLKLYFNQDGDSQLCDADMHVISSYGDSGHLATICCGNSQTMWRDKSTTSQLVGDLYLQCRKI